MPFGLARPHEHCNQPIYGAAILNQDKLSNPHTKARVSAPTGIIGKEKQCWTHLLLGRLGVLVSMWKAIERLLKEATDLRTTKGDSWSAAQPGRAEKLCGVGQVLQCPATLLALLAMGREGLKQLKVAMMCPAQMSSLSCPSTRKLHQTVRDSSTVLRIMLSCTVALHRLLGNYCLLWIISSKAHWILGSNAHEPLLFL